MGGDDSIVSELTSWREGALVGLFRGSVRLRSATENASASIVVKVKPSDENVLEVAQSVATLAGASLGEEYARFRDYHGFTRCHVRELALYRDSDPRLRRHSPALLALSTAGDTQRLTLVLDELPASSLFHAGKSDAAWKPDLLHAAIDGAAEIHSVWYRREAELMAMPWLAPVRDSRRLTEMRPLWSALADHARAHSAAWSDATLVRIHRRLVECVAEWSVPLTSLPRTLIHNDFNPRKHARKSLVIWRCRARALHRPPECTSTATIGNSASVHRYASCSSIDSPCTRWSTGFDRKVICRGSYEDG
jgi:hydroxymethylglutaryl-CoA reductase (NADPH)